jgi:hypothetical protein
MRNTISSIDVIVTALGRPELLSQFAESLARQVGVQDLRLRVYLFQDSPIVPGGGAPIANPELCRRCPDVFLAQLPDAQLVSAETNLGIVGNTERIFEHVKISDADAFVIFEEDLILSEHYLATIAQLLTQAAQNSLIGLVNGAHEQVRDLETQQQKPAAMVNMGQYKWGIGFDRRTYNRMGSYLDAYFAVCRKAGYRCNGRDRLEVTRAAQRFFHELGFPRPLPGAAPDIALHVFSYLYLMHNISTWVCLAKYTGRAGLNFNPGSYDRMNLGAAQLYDRRVEAFDMPTFAKSLAVVTAWRHDLLNLRLAELSREASGAQ